LDERTAGLRQLDSFKRLKMRPCGAFFVCGTSVPAIRSSPSILPVHSLQFY